MRIEQYFLMTDYSLWEVIINGDSPVPTRLAKGTTTQNLAFVSSSNTDSTTESVSAATSVSAVYAKMHVSSLPNMAMLTMRARRFLQKTGKNLGANGPTSMGFDMSKVECYNSHRKGHFARECRSPKDSRRSGDAGPQKRTVPVETSTSNALVSQCDGTRSYDWSYQAEEEPVNYALMAFSSSSSSFDNEAPSCSKACSKAYAQLHTQYDKLTDDFRKFQFDVISYQTVQLRDTALVTLRQKLEKAEQERDDLKLKLEKFQTSSKNLTELLASQTNEKTGLGYNLQVFTQAMFDYDDYFSLESDCETWPPSSLYDRFQPSGGYHAVPPPTTGTFMPPKPNLVFHTALIAVGTDHSTFTPIETSITAATPKPASPKSNSSGKRRNRKACFVCKSVDHMIKDCDYHAKKMAQPTPRNYAHRRNHKQYASLTHTNPSKHMVPAAVLTQSKPVSITAARPVSDDVPKIMVTRPRLAHKIVTMSKSPIRRHITPSQFPKTSNSPPRVIAVQALVGGKISGKGKIKTGKLDFKDVYFVKELKFNLFSVSQMCDKKNSVLFTDTECLVLSSDFKLPDESQVLLRVPKENNMYNVDLKNIVPSGDFTCLFAKAIIDESNL
nr:ribonuclease H-like domain-containing protein [Tanacetum cinerariifolium]